MGRVRRRDHRRRDLRCPSLPVSDLRLSAILESQPREFLPLSQLCTHPVRGLYLRRRFPKCQLCGGRMARRLQKLPDYFTEEEAVAKLVDAAPSYPTRMAFRIMLRTGLRVSEALALRQC